MRVCGELQRVGSMLLALTTRSYFEMEARTVEAHVSPQPQILPLLKTLSSCDGVLVDFLFIEASQGIPGPAHLLSPGFVGSTSSRRLMLESASWHGLLSLLCTCPATREPPKALCMGTQSWQVSRVDAESLTPLGGDANLITSSRKRIWQAFASYTPGLRLLKCAVTCSAAEALKCRRA